MRLGFLVLVLFLTSCKPTPKYCGDSFYINIKNEDVFSSKEEKEDFNLYKIKENGHEMIIYEGNHPGIEGSGSFVDIDFLEYNSLIFEKIEDSSFPYAYIYTKNKRTLYFVTSEDLFPEFPRFVVVHLSSGYAEQKHKSLDQSIFRNKIEPFVIFIFKAIEVTVGISDSFNNPQTLSLAFGWHSNSRMRLR